MAPSIQDGNTNSKWGLIFKMHISLMVSQIKNGVSNLKYCLSFKITSQIQDGWGLTFKMAPHIHYGASHSKWRLTFKMASHIQNGAIAFKMASSRLDLKFKMASGLPEDPVSLDPALLELCLQVVTVGVLDTTQTRL